MIIAQRIRPVLAQRSHSQRERGDTRLDAMLVGIRIATTTAEQPGLAISSQMGDEYVALTQTRQLGDWS